MLHIQIKARISFHGTDSPQLKRMYGMIFLFFNFDILDKMYDVQCKYRKDIIACLVVFFLDYDVIIFVLMLVWVHIIFVFEF